MDINFIKNEIKTRGYMRFESVLLERVEELQGAILKHEEYTRSHNQVVSLEDEELYGHIRKGDL